MYRLIATSNEVLYLTLKKEPSSVMRTLHSGSFWSYTPARLAGTVVLALLVAVGSVLSFAQPARAGIRVPSTLYTHIATSANTFGDFTLLDNTVTNNNPQAVIAVTANWNPNGGANPGFDDHRVGVWYDSEAAKWGIFNEDQTAMPMGAAFNVYAFSASSSADYVVTATSTNTLQDGYFFPFSGAPASALFLITPNWNPTGGSQGVFDPYIVWEQMRQTGWEMLNQVSGVNDQQMPIPIGASFNIIEVTGTTDTWVQISSDGNILPVTPANIYGDSTCLNAVGASDGWNTNPNSLLLITIRSDPVPYVMGVWYDASLGDWCIFNGSFSSMKPTLEFVVFSSLTF